MGFFFSLLLFDLRLFIVSASGSPTRAELEITSGRASVSVKTLCYFQVDIFVLPRSGNFVLYSSGDLVSFSTGDFFLGGRGN